MCLFFWGGGENKELKKESITPKKRYLEILMFVFPDCYTKCTKGFSNPEFKGFFFYFFFLLQKCYSFPNPEISVPP